MSYEDGLFFYDAEFERCLALTGLFFITLLSFFKDRLAL
jgi:hypothetical protein